MKKVRATDDDVTLEFTFEGETISETRAKELMLAGKAHIVRRSPFGPQRARVELESGPAPGWVAQSQRNQETMRRHWHPDE